MFERNGRDYFEHVSSRDTKSQIALAIVPLKRSIFSLWVYVNRDEL